MGQDRREIADLDALVSRFLAGTLTTADWTHQAHLRVGAWHVATLGPDDALARLRDGIRALNDRHGTVNSETSGYHETITRAYVTLMAAALAADAGGSLAERVEAVVNGPLGERDALLRWYSREALLSPRARLGWVEPDRYALPS